MADKTADRVIRVISEQLGVPPSDVTPDKHLIADLGADSLDTVELVMALEDEFGIEIDDTKAESLVTVSAILEYAESVVK